jgi:hypothetical protein
MTQQRTTLADLILVVRYLLKFSAEERTIKSQAVFAQANEAATYLKVTGRAHPFYGDGTLSAVVLRHGFSGMPLDMNQDVLEAFHVVLGEFSHQQECHSYVSKSDPSRNAMSWITSLHLFFRAYLR